MTLAHTGYTAGQVLRLDTVPVPDRHRNAVEYPAV